MQIDYVDYVQRRVRITQKVPPSDAFDVLLFSWYLYTYIYIIDLYIYAVIICAEYNILHTYLCGYTV